MRVIINEQEVNIPSSLSEITLQQRINFQRQHGDLLDEMLKSIFEMPEGLDKNAEYTEFIKKKAVATFSFYSGIDAGIIEESEFLDRVISISLQCEKLITLEEEALEISHEIMWEGEKWCLPGVELTNGDKMKFGELIDSKQIVKDMTDQGASAIECLFPVSAIFFRKAGEEYSESFLYENSERLKLMERLPMSIALQVSMFFNLHSQYLLDHFPIFWPSKVRNSGQNTKKHFERFGWINFLSAISKTKVFDITGSGMNSIDCVRQASCFDVLLFASEEKELAEATYLDHEIEMQKRK